MLNPEERDRRRQNNLCLNCGATGHFLRNYPIQLSKSKNPCPSFIQLSGTCLLTSFFSSRCKWLKGRSNCGAFSCFLDINLANNLHIPPNLKVQKLDIFNLLTALHSALDPSPKRQCHQISYIPSHPWNTLVAGTQPYN